MEMIVIIPLLYGGGIAAATILMILASWKRRSMAKLLLFFLAANFCLVAQPGCWSRASKIGYATGGGNSTEWHSVIAVCNLILVVWGIILFLLRRERDDDTTS